DRAFDADAYAVHGSMRGYRPPAPDTPPPVVNPVRNADYALPEKEKKGRKSSRERINEYEREIEAIQRRTRAIDAERQTIGLSAGATAKAEAAFRLLEAA